MSLWLASTGSAALADSAISTSFAGSISSKPLANSLTFLTTASTGPFGWRE